MNTEMPLDEGKGEKGKNFENEGLTRRIIGAAIEVHRALGPGFLESIYEKAFSLELEYAGLTFERRKLVPIFYRGEIVGEHRLDLLVEGKVVVELKAIQKIEPIHFSVMRSYLHALDLRFGLLLNFAAAPLTIRRVETEGGDVRNH